MVGPVVVVCCFCFSNVRAFARNGKHVLVAYIMKPKAGYDYLATAAHFAAESSTGTNVNVCTTDDFTKSVDALVYYIDPDNEEMKIAYPNLLFDRNITDGRAMMCSFLTLAIGNNQGNLAMFWRGQFSVSSHYIVHWQICRWQATRVDGKISE